MPVHKGNVNEQVKEEMANVLICIVKAVGTFIGFHKLKQAESGHDI